VTRTETEARGPKGAYT